MKKIILLALLCISFVAAQAATIINRTGCTVTVTAVCYDPSNCTFTPCGPAMVIPPLGVIPLPVCPCPTLWLQGYSVCWGDPGCAGICTTIGDPTGGPCASFGVTATLPRCPVCPAALGIIGWSAVGNMEIR